MDRREERGSIEVAGERTVSCAWILPDGARCVLALAPGAGAPFDSPFLEGFARAIGDLGVATMRFNFPYQEGARRPPDREPVLRATWEAAFGVASERASGDGIAVAAGGKSLGARIASMCVADGMTAPALVFLGYPLHPPGRPERIRDAHLDRIAVPMLWLQGTRDPFAEPDLLAGVLARLGTRATFEPVADADHSFHVRGTPRDPAAEGAALAPAVAGFLSRTLGAR